MGIMIFAIYRKFHEEFPKNVTVLYKYRFFFLTNIDKSQYVVKFR